MMKIKIKMINNPINIETDNVLRLARKYGEQIKEELVFGEIEQINLAKDDEIVFRYEGPSPQRDFCKEMIRLNKFYSREEINIMSFSGKNKSFGHNGNNYSIWKYHGGSYCKHHWEAYTIRRDKNNRITQTVKIGPAKGAAGEAANAGNNFYRYS